MLKENQELDILAYQTHKEKERKISPSVDNTFAEQRLEGILAQETNNLTAGLHRF